MQYIQYRNYMIERNKYLTLQFFLHVVKGHLAILFPCLLRCREQGKEILQRLSLYLGGTEVTKLQNATAIQ